MRHHSNKRILGRNRNQHTALLRGLAKSLLLHGRIETTTSKAKELRPFIERLITHAKKDSVASRRLTGARLGNSAAAVKRLHDDVAKRYETRNGGYTRIVKTGIRSHEDKAIIEFV